MLSKSAKGIVCSSETQILWLVWDTKAVSSLTLLIVVVEDWQRQVVVCSQVFINSVLGWLDVLGLEKAVVILTYIVLDIEPGWNKFCFQSSSCVWMISRLNQDSLKTVLCFPKQQWSLQVFFFVWFGFWPLQLTFRYTNVQHPCIGSVFKRKVLWRSWGQRKLLDPVPLLL